MLYKILFNLAYPALFLCLSLLEGRAREAETSPDKRTESNVRLFYLSFEDGFRAEAGGDGTPSNSTNTPSLVKGYKGKGARFSEGDFLKFNTRGNLNVSEGSLSVWIKNASSLSVNRLKRPHLFFQMEDYDSNSINASLVSAGILPDFGVFVETNKNPTNKNWRTGFAVPAFSLRETSHWHHVVVTWDYSRGVKIFMNGSLVLNKLIQKADIEEYKAFILGDTQHQHNLDLIIDEFSLYNYELSEDEVWSSYLKSGGEFEVEVDVLDPFLTEGETQEIPLLFHNRDNRNVDITSVSYKLLNSKRKEVRSGNLEGFSISKRQQSTIDLELGPAPKPGDYILKLNYMDIGLPGVLVDTIRVLEASESGNTDPSERSLIFSLKATDIKPVAEFGKASVVSSPIGDYLEAGSRKNHRFAVDFAINDIGKLHEAVVTYPDDKPRTMEVVLQDLAGFRDYQAQSGVFTGNEYPITGEIKEHRFLFWPHSRQQVLIFMTAVNDQPAAIQDIKINRLDHLSPTDTSGLFKGSVPAREIGLYYEDPVLNRSFGGEADFAGFSLATTRLIDYMTSFGQNTLHYPVAWYEGPHYGTSVEQYQPNSYRGQGGIRHRPQGHIRYLMKRLHTRGMKFNAGLHLHTLQSLENIAITDWDEINAGKETVLNIKGNGELWYAKFHGSDPGYNPIDPRVQERVKAIIDEVAERYGREPAFTGITLKMERVSLFTFGSIEAGYNDSNLNNFQKETGISIPDYVPGDPKRFSKSYLWLMENQSAKEAWIDWRCREFYDFYKEIAEGLSQYGENLTLTLSVFRHRTTYEELSDYLVKSPLDALREIGIDPRLYLKEDNIVLGYTQAPADLRWRQSKSDPERNIEANRTVFTAPEIYEHSLKKHPVEVTIHDRYWEDPVGRNKPLKGLYDAHNIKELGWRVSTLNATDFHSLEPYVAALNNLDVFRITKGGFLIGTYGIEDELTDFSKAFSALPAVKFEDINGLEDPIRVRKAIVDGKLYFYVLNRLPMPVEIKINVTPENGILEIVNQKVYSGQQLALSLKPYDLRVFRSENVNQKIIDGEVARGAWLVQIKENFKNISETAKSVGKDSDEMISVLPYLEKAEQCWKNGEYARLYFLLQEGWVKEIERMSKK